jgi:stage III sporulation protein AD
VNIITVSGFALLGVLVVTVLKSVRPDYATAAGIVTGILLLAFTMTPLQKVLSSVLSLAEDTGFSAYSSVILKSMGIGILGQTAADVCRDSGLGTVAGKVEFAAKVLILLLCMPVLETLLTLIEEFLK